MRGRLRLTENVTYELKDKDGNVKPLFEVNAFGRTFLELARKGYTPYNSDGSVKRGLRAYLALYGLRISGITGQWVQAMEVSNLLPTVGKALVAGRINGSGSPAAAGWIGIGTGTTAAAAGDTALEAEKAADGTASTTHTSATASLVTTDVTNDTAQLVATFSITGTIAVTESGVFNASANGTILARQTFSAINVVSGDSLQLTWKFDVD